MVTHTALAMRYGAGAVFEQTHHVGCAFKQAG